MAEGEGIVVKVDGERGLEAALAQVALTARAGDNNGIEDGLPVQSTSKLMGGADGLEGEEEKEGHAQLAYQGQDQKEDDTDRITLPAFRLLCLSNPLLDTFFSSQLPASFQLEVVDRASLNGTSIWHDISAASSSKVSSSSAMPHASCSSSSSSLSSSSSSNTITPSGTPSSTSFFPFGGGLPSSPLKSSQMKKASSSAVAAAEAPSSFSASGSSTTIFSATGPNSASTSSPSSSLNPSSSSPALFRAYSKDVSTGVVGKIGGFLNTFLGDEVKTKVDQLADSLGEKLHTKVIRGPMPSFANLSSSSGGGGIQGGGPNGRGGGGVLGMDDLRAMEEERRERRRIREQEDREEEEQEEEERLAKGASRSGGGSSSGDKRGINLLAAQESLRRATEAVVEGRQAPTTDSSHSTVGAAGDEDEGDEEIVGEDGLI